jgi:hypothetical protein
MTIDLGGNQGGTGVGVPLAAFCAVLAEVGLTPSSPSRVEEEGEYLYLCFDDDRGEEIGFMICRELEVVCCVIVRTCPRPATLSEGIAPTRANGGH